MEDLRVRAFLAKHKAPPLGMRGERREAGGGQWHTTRVLEVGVLDRVLRMARGEGPARAGSLRPEVAAALQERIGRYASELPPGSQAAGLLAAEGEEGRAQLCLGACSILSAGGLAEEQSVATVVLHEAARRPIAWESVTDEEVAALVELCASARAGAGRGDPRRRPWVWEVGLMHELAVQGVAARPQVVSPAVLTALGEAVASNPAAGSERVRVLNRLRQVAGGAGGVYPGVLAGTGWGRAAQSLWEARAEDRRRAVRISADEDDPLSALLARAQQDSSGGQGAGEVWDELAGEVSEVGEDAEGGGRGVLLERAEVHEIVEVAMQVMSTQPGRQLRDRLRRVCGGHPQGRAVLHVLLESLPEITPVRVSGIGRSREVYVSEVEEHLGRGLCAALGSYGGSPADARVLEEVIVWGGSHRPQADADREPRGGAIALGAIAALGRGGGEGLDALRRCVHTHRLFKAHQRGAAKALAEVLDRCGIDPEEYEGRFVSDHGLDATGHASVELGEWVGEIRTSSGAAVLTFRTRSGTKARRTPPGELKREHADALRVLRGRVREIEAAIEAERQRLTRMVRSGRSLELPQLQAEVLDRPITRAAARFSVWELVVEGEVRGSAHVDEALQWSAAPEPSALTRGVLRLWQPGSAASPLVEELRGAGVLGLGQDE